MYRRGFIVTAAVAVGLTIGCRGPNPDDLPQMVGVEGCLTAAEGDLVLTRLTSAAPRGAEGGAPAAEGGTLPAQQSTEMFILKGMEDELRPHVGQQVRVRGEAHPPEVGVVRQHETAVPSGATGGAAEPGAVGTAGGGEPQVTTMQKTRFATTDLQVRAVTPLNRPCVVP
jgi:hypothetical protein